MNRQDELSPKEKAVLKILKQPVEPEIQLEENIVEKLKHEGLIRRQFHTRIWMFQVAASVILLAVGLFAGKLLFDRGEEHTQFNYMLVLYEDAQFSPTEPEQMFYEYAQWMQQIQEKGLVIDGQEMKSTSLFVKPDGELVKTQDQRKVGGYFVLKATSMDQVLAIAKDSPHLKYGGTIEVKEFMIR